MIGLFIMIYFIYLVLIFLSRKEEISKKQSYIDGLFEKMAKWLSKRPLVKNLRSPKVKENLNMLSPAKDVQVLFSPRALHIPTLRLAATPSFSLSTITTL